MKSFGILNIYVEVNRMLSSIILGLMQVIDWIGYITGASVITIIDWLNNIWYMIN